MKFRHSLAVCGLGCFLALVNAAVAVGMEEKQDLRSVQPVANGNSLDAAFGAKRSESVLIPQAGHQQDLPAAKANSLSGEAQYVPNHPWQDFEVEFFVAVPFAAFYSYLTVLSLDGMVQNHFPPELRQADIWVIMGLAAGSAFAVALGSVGRVPDQSVPRIEAADVGWPQDRSRSSGNLINIADIQIRY